MNWDDPVARYRLIDRVGASEYSRLQKQEHERQVIERVNGHAIRKVHSPRFGVIYMVEDLIRGHSTLEGARKIARGEP